MSTEEQDWESQLLNQERARHNSIQWEEVTPNRVPETPLSRFFNQRRMRNG